MMYSIPSTEVVKAALRSLSHSDLRVIGKSTGVAVSTLIKIRHGTTTNPGIETVRSILASPKVRTAYRAHAAKPAQQKAT